MDKLLLNFIDKYKLECVTDKLMYGSINNYQMALKISEGNVFRVYFFTKISVELSQKINLYFSEDIDLNCDSFQVYHYGCSFIIKAFSKKRGYRYVEELIDKVSAFLSDNNALDDSYCPICGMKMSEKEFVILDGIKFYVDLDCKKLIEEKMTRKNEIGDEVPNNYLRGFMGAAIGGLIGIVVWVLVGAVFGLISGWCAALLMWLTGKGYLLAGGKNGKIRVVASSVITFIYIFISMILVYTILAFKIDKSLFDIISIGDPLMAIFVGDLSIALIFMLVIVIYSVRQLRKLEN